MEVLISVAILAILLLILIPAVTKGKEMAYSAACTSNLRNIGSIIRLYVAENNGFLPPGRSQNTQTLQIKGWYSDNSWLEPYVDGGWKVNSKIRRCPADKTAKTPGYASNLYYLQDWNDGKPQTIPVYAGYVRAETATRKILMADAMKTPTGIFQYGSIKTDLSKRHQGRANCLFGDGSVQLLHPENEITGDMYVFPKK